MVCSLLCTLPMLCDVNLSHCTRLDDNCVVQLARCVPVLIRLNIDGIAHITNRLCRGTIVSINTAAELSEGCN